MSKQAKIIYFGNSHLRFNCLPVTVFHKGLHQKIDLISTTLRNNGGGAALAAPQISLLKRVIVIDYLGKYFELINPEIIEEFGEQTDFEGCLSLPGFSGNVTRYKNIKVNFQNRFGEYQTVEIKDHMARCFQHEIDHLNGILYIDRMIDEYVFNNETNEKIAVKHLLELTSKQFNI